LQEVAREQGDVLSYTAASMEALRTREEETSAAARR
jgi:hypothetical protein